jgi:hypothetical protein
MNESQPPHRVAALIDAHVARVGRSDSNSDAIVVEIVRMILTAHFATMPAAGVTLLADDLCKQIPRWAKDALPIFAAHCDPAPYELDPEPES